MNVQLEVLMATTKSDLVEQLAARVGLSKAAADRVIKALFSAEDGLLTAALKGGDGAKVGVQGFGSFEVSSRPAHETTKPGDPTQKIQVPARNVVRFKAGKNLKAALNSAPTAA
jgi:DNA-binding protein HU-beta